MGIPIADNEHQNIKSRRALFRNISTLAIICLLLLTVVSLDCFSERARAQHTKVPKEPFQVTDTSTGKMIPEILVIPRYSSAIGMGIPPEGPSRFTARRNYLDKPFVYRTGDPFKIRKQPKAFPPVPLLLFVFVGKVREIDGILVIAPGYRPLWTDDLWWSPDSSYERKLQLTPISDHEWLLVLEKQLGPFVKDASRVSENCRIWNLPEKCTLEIDYDKKERELVRSFLQQARKHTK